MYIFIYVYICIYTRYIFFKMYIYTYLTICTDQRHPRDISCRLGCIYNNMIYNNI